MRQQVMNPVQQQQQQQMQQQQQEQSAAAAAATAPAAKGPGIYWMHGTRRCYIHGSDYKQTCQDCQAIIDFYDACAQSNVDAAAAEKVYNQQQQQQQ